MILHTRIIIAILALSQTLTLAADNDALKREVIAIADKMAGEIDAMSIRLWDLSETALKEQQSSAYLADILERNGFKVERGVAGMPTAFTASYGKGKLKSAGKTEYFAII